MPPCPETTSCFRYEFVQIVVVVPLLQWFMRYVNIRTFRHHLFRNDNRFVFDAENFPRVRLDIVAFMWYL